MTANKERDAAGKRAYYEKNKAAFISRSKEWQKDNPEKVATSRLMQSARRRAKISGVTPAWANIFFIREIYDLARRRNRLLSGGVKWQVDHIVPLRSKFVCGLHVEHNLRVIPELDNRKKNNKYWPDMTSIGA